MQRSVTLGMFDREVYGPAIARGRAALTTAVSPEGRLGRVPRIGDNPEKVRADGSQL